MTIQEKYNLTDNRYHLILLAMSGKSYPEIAQLLYKSISTVKNTIHITQNECFHTNNLLDTAFLVLSDLTGMDIDSLLENELQKIGEKLK